MSAADILKLAKKSSILCILYATNKQYLLQTPPFYKQEGYPGTRRPSGTHIQTMEEDDEPAVASSSQRMFTKKKMHEAVPAAPRRLFSNVHLPKDWHSVVGAAAAAAAASKSTSAASLPSSSLPSKITADAQPMQPSSISIKCGGHLKKIQSTRKNKQRTRARKKNETPDSQVDNDDDDNDAHATTDEQVTPDEQGLSSARAKKRQRSTVTTVTTSIKSPSNRRSQSSSSSAAVATASSIIKGAKPCFSPSAPSLFPPPPCTSLQHNYNSSSGSTLSISSAAATSSSSGLPHSTRDACENILAAIQRSGFGAAAAAAAASETAGMENNNNNTARGGGGIQAAEDLQHHHHLQPTPHILQQAPPINLDHILSKVPYKDMLKDLFGSNASCPKGYRAPIIPVVSRVYEESYMRQPMYEYERQCVMGTNCECNFIGTKAGEGFVAVEFLLPSDAAVAASSAAMMTSSSCYEPQKQQQQQQMCVLCHRRLVQSLFYDIIYSGELYCRIVLECNIRLPDSIFHDMSTVWLQVLPTEVSFSGTATSAIRRTNMPGKFA